MIIIIAKQNEQLIQNLIPEKKLKFKDATPNTSYFRVNRNVFKKLFSNLLEKGYSPFELMRWLTENRSLKNKK
jgi:hypothetical protein